MAEKILNSKCVVIGGSAGSLNVLLNLLSKLTGPLTFALIIVLHRKNDSTSNLAEVMSHRSLLPVKEAEDKEVLLPGMVYLAPAGYHLLIERDQTFSLDGSEKVNYSRPSLDVTFETAAEAFGTGLTGILLSGANEDGCKGFEHIRSCGGMLIVQDPQVALSPAMPQSAIDHGYFDLILKDQEILEFLIFENR